MDEFDFKIDIDLVKKMFDEHLADKKNNRILFSGAFGMGKTYFLEKYFNQNSNFIPIHLYPVNYQVSKNEDVFELLKYDILLELISKDWIKNDVEIGRGLALQSYMLNRGFNGALSVLQNLPKVGKSFKSLQKVVEFLEGFSEYESDLNSGNLDIVNHYAQFFEEKKGGVHEFDAITNIIIDTLIQNKDDKEVVLILDDLDRIDPEHLFRILNIFSAHFDSVSDSENKFGFDRVILVCDVNNLRSIFSSKYGVKTDFNGYVDKFYSNSVFVFDNQAKVQLFLRELLDFYISRNEKMPRPFKETLYYCTIPIILIFVRTNLLNLRDLKRIHQRKFSYTKSYRASAWEDGNSVRNFEFLGFLIIDYLLFVFGNNVNKLLTVIDNSHDRLSSKAIDKDSLAYILHLSNPYF